MELPERQARLAFDARAGDDSKRLPILGPAGVPKSGEDGDEGSGEGKVEHRRERQGPGVEPSEAQHDQQVHDRNHRDNAGDQ